MPIEKCRELAQRWYAGRLARDWQRPGLRRSQQVFDDLGLCGAFWDLGAAA